ncbi:MAG: phosphatase PAP2 family protein [Gemmatimonadota bacterium]|nr:phosphatase PAP2 family protein [Gemmatimonadota bacterium]
MNDDVLAGGTSRMGRTPGMWAALRRWQASSVIAWTAGGYAAAAVTGILFALMLRGTGDWATGLPWERDLLLATHVTLPPVLDAAMLVLPWLGTNITLLPLTLAAAAWLLLVRRRADLAAHLVVVEVGAWTLVPILKELFQRPRPELWEWRGQFAWSSYPSGHAITSTAVLLTVAILLRRERGWTWPAWLLVALIAVSLYSRIYLGVHWPTDLIGGVLVGLVWLIATLRAFRPPLHPG